MSTAPTITVDGHTYSIETRGGVVGFARPSYKEFHVITYTPKQVANHGSFTGFSAKYGRYTYDGGFVVKFTDDQHQAFIVNDGVSDTTMARPPSVSLLSRHTFENQEILEFIPIPRVMTLGVESPNDSKPFALSL